MNRIALYRKKRIESNRTAMSTCSPSVHNPLFEERPPIRSYPGIIIILPIELPRFRSTVDVRGLLGRSEGAAAGRARVLRGRRTGTSGQIKRMVCYNLLTHIVAYRDHTTELP